MQGYKQAFVVTCENGQVWLSVVMGEDPNHGEGLALSEVGYRAGCQVWDCCAYPVTKGLRLGTWLMRWPLHY